MKASLAAVLLALALGCDGANGPHGGPDGGGGSTGGEPWLGYRSGDRIKMRLGVTGDGASALLGWHDASLGVECEFRRAADGATRCLPRAAKAILFSDAACTRPLAYPGDSCTPRARHLLLTEMATDSCSRLFENTRVFEVSDRVHTGPVYVNTGLPDRCDPFAETGLLETTELAAATFVEQVVAVDD